MDCHHRRVREAVFTGPCGDTLRRSEYLCVLRSAPGEAAPARSRGGGYEPTNPDEECPPLLLVRTDLCPLRSGRGADA